jgi:hypothetical protein
LYGLDALMKYPLMKQMCSQQYNHCYKPQQEIDAEKAYRYYEMDKRYSVHAKIILPPFLKNNN